MAQRQTAIIVILALLLCLQPLSVPASAKKSTQLGSEWGHYSDENRLTSSIMSLITSYSTAAGYNSTNWFGGQTTANNIYAAASTDNKSIAIYKGHGGNDTLTHGQQWCVTDNDGNLVWDYNIFGNSSGIRFAFLWSCEQGDTVGGDYLGGGAPYGMPYAWLHPGLRSNGIANLTYQGYLSPDGGNKTFIGFNGSPPILGYNHWSSDGSWVSRAGYCFLESFYLAALCMGLSVNASLDYAARFVWPSSLSFSDSVAYSGAPNCPDGPIGNMVVYGDGGMKLSNGVPVCAMKTKTDGYFYVPDFESSYGKIEWLFNDSTFVGDQTGPATPPYPTITRWPDGRINLLDVFLIRIKWGLKEGDVGWEYMADLVPDGVINLLDDFTVRLNFGKPSGTYPPISLTKVKVMLEGSLEVDPDQNGFFRIYEGATSFNVTMKESGVGIGALITFYG